MLQRVLIRELHYGITSLCGRDLDASQEDQLTSYDTVDEQDINSLHLPKTWTRAAILTRINSLIKGCSAVRHVVVQRLGDLLTHDIVPVVPLRGSISASGDLSPMSYIGGAIQGKPTIRIHAKGFRDLFADQAFAHTGISPVVLNAKEGLAIVNGTAVSAACGALALYDAHTLALLAQVITAMSVEALNGTVESFDAFFSLMRPHPGQTEAARNIQSFLDGSKLTEVNTGDGMTLRQDRYSVRTAPQWIGPVLEDFLLAHQQITVECNSATDNPLVNDIGQILHGGNFQAKSVTSAMEKVRQGNCTIGRMLFTQCVEMINPATSRGLTPNLVMEDPSTSFIFKGTDINIAALQAELGFLSTPVNHIQTAEMGNQSLNSLALISARYTHTSNDVLTQMMAAHLIAVCQALDLRVMQKQYLESFRLEFETLFQLFSSEYLQEMTGDAATDLALLDALWKQIVKNFDITVTLDAKERFMTIAQACRPILLDSARICTSRKPLEAIETFYKKLAKAMYRTWLTHREAYFAHGDAAPYLGEASACMYAFIRKTLGVPILHSELIRTPSTEQAAGDIQQAPTVGSYTSMVYRSLRDGRIIAPLQDILQRIVPSNL
jgi:phenylalanine ammonia-lyase